MTVALEDRNHVHFVGIGGIGMSALARLLLAQGHQVSGSDSSQGEQVTALEQLGARVAIGHDAEHVDGADLVVVTSAARADNPEIKAARQARIPVMKRSELLAAVMNPRQGVAVAGTHGKTTTSGLIAHILTQANLDPTVLIGGVSPDLGSNARVGSDLVVAEADEYDASFLHLRPHIGVITNVEPDHLDFYGSVDRLHSAFQEFAAAVTDTLVVFADDPVLLELVEPSPARLIAYGLVRGEWRAEEIDNRDCMTHFTLVRGNTRVACSMRLAAHNVPNALAALAVADALGVPLESATGALATFSGVERRFELKGEVNGVLVMDDYGHHPTEVRMTLAAMKARYRRPIRLIFQPHTYTRTREFLDDFASAFVDADAVYLLDIYAARETDTLGVSSRDLARAAQEHHPHVEYVGTMEKALLSLLGDTRSGEMVVTMGAGDVYRLAPMVLEGLAQK